MKIPECDMTYITVFRPSCLLTLTSPIRHIMDYTQINSIQLKTLELEIDFAEYIQYTDARKADLC